MNGQSYMSKDERKAARQQTQNPLNPENTAAPDPVPDTEVELTQESAVQETAPVTETPVEPDPTPISPTKSQETVRVRVTVAALNIREEPTMNSQKLGAITDRGIYAIVEQKDGWGRLESGLGWIGLQFTSRVN